jgi:hypothetical protein
MLQPRIAARRNDPRRFIPLAPDVLARRAEIAQRLQAQIQPLSAHLRAMTAEERRAIFLKIEHDGPINLSGTGLKPIAETSERFTLAVPRKDDLSALSDKVNTFATEVPRNGELPNSRLVTAIETIAMGRPEDRLSQELLDQYEDLITRDAIICEVELLSLENGRNKQRNELSSIRHQLQADSIATGALVRCSNTRRSKERVESSSGVQEPFSKGSLRKENGSAESTGLKLGRNSKRLTVSSPISTWRLLALYRHLQMMRRRFASSTAALVLAIPFYGQSCARIYFNLSASLTRRSV